MKQTGEPINAKKLLLSSASSKRGLNDGGRGYLKRRRAVILTTEGRKDIETSCVLDRALQVYIYLLGVDLFLTLSILTTGFCKIVKLR